MDNEYKAKRLTFYYVDGSKDIFINVEYRYYSDTRTFEIILKNKNIIIINYSNVLKHIIKR